MIWMMMIIIITREQNSNQNNTDELEMLDIVVLDSTSTTSAIQSDNTTINGLERIKAENDHRRRQLYLELVPPVIIHPADCGRLCLA
jgi:hypothetical protein